MPAQITRSIYWRDSSSKPREGDQRHFNLEQMLARQAGLETKFIEPGRCVLFWNYKFVLNSILVCPVGSPS